jgi:hemolysin III
VHSWAFLCSVPAGVALVALANGALARVAVAIYAVSLVAVFATSAAYHRLARTPTAWRRLRRLDHAMIYALIAGTFTPVCLVSLPLAWGVPLLVVMWIVAVVGIVLKGTGNERLIPFANALYFVMGWSAVIAVPVMVDRVRPTALALMAAGGVVYTLGAVVLLRRRPDPRPSVFGFHEIWHACTVVAATTHYAMVWAITA